MPAVSSGVTASHKKFYYKGEHVILTTKSGGLSLLENAISYLKENFTGLPIIQTYHAVGDSKRPQHKTLLFDDDRIIVTGKKSSGLVGQVYDALSAHFKIPTDPPRTETRQTQKVQPLCTEVSCERDSTGEQWNADSKVVSFVSGTLPCAQTDSSIQELCTLVNKVTCAPSLHKEQKKRVITSNSLFSRAITAIHSQSRTGTHSTNSTGSTSSRSNSECSPDIVVIDYPTSSAKQSDERSNRTSTDNIPLKDSKSHAAETNNNGPSTGHAFNQCTTSSPSDATTDTSGKDVCSHGSNNICNQSTIKPSFKLVAEVEGDVEAVASAGLSDTVSCEAVAKLLSGGAIINGDINGACNAASAATDTSNAVSGSNASNQLVDGTPQELGPAAEPAIVYKRDVLLELSRSELGTEYPSHLLINTECEILITLPTADEMFDPGEHRMPHVDEDIFNPYSNPYNPGMRRHLNEPQERRYTSTSDPRSCGDSSVHKRSRKLHSAPCVEVLYSESAYNRLDQVPENATYCPELDEVFKNRDKLVPGVAFTRRPKESQNDQYVAELLNYYESQGN